MLFGDPVVTARLDAGFDVSKLPPAHETSREAVLDPAVERRARIQRIVNVTAAILFGALGAFTGTALVVLMLVALVIPTTTTVVLAGIAATMAVFIIALWLKRRAAVALKHGNAVTLEHFAGFPA